MTATANRRAIETIGRLLFGKPGRMTLGMFCAMRQGDQVVYGDYRGECKRRDWPVLPAFKPDIDRFEQLGLVVRLPQPAASRAQPYQVEKHHLWVAFMHIATISPVLSAGVPGDGDTKFAIGPRIHPDVARDEMLDMERHLRAGRLEFDAAPDMVDVVDRSGLLG